MKIRAINRQKGLSLLEFTVVLALLAGAAVMLMPGREEAPAFVQEEALLNVVDQQLIYFIATSSRLPCPDYTGNGWEDCGAGQTRKGGLPYRTLGMSSASYGLADLPLLYGVYRNPNNTLVQGGSGGFAYLHDADLTAARNRFEPAMADGEWLNFGNAGAASDFCAALTAAQQKSFSSTRTFVDDGASRYNVAYAIASPGRYDSDGANGLFDGINGQDDYGFNSDNTPLSGNYDDRVRSRTFSELSTRLQCASLLQSLNLIANGRQTEIEVAATLSGNQRDTTIGSVINGVGIAFNVVDVVQSGFAVSNAVTHGVTGGGLLAGAIASCAVLVGCAMIPVYAASVAAAATGATAAAAAVIATTVSTAAQIATTALYVTAAVQMSLTDLEFENVDLGEALDTMQELEIELEKEVAALDVELANAELALSAAEQTRDNRLDTISSYVEANGGPDPQDAEFQQRLDTLIEESDRLNEAQLNFDRKAARHESLASECKAHADGYTDTETGASIAPNPDHPSCADAQAALAEQTAAQAELDSQHAARQAAMVSAQAAANDFQVYQGTDSEGNALYTPCGELSGCTLDSEIHYTSGDGEDEVNHGLAAEMDSYHRRRAEVESLQLQRDNQAESLFELSNAIAAMECSAQGNVFNPDTQVCGAADEAGEGAAIGFSLGAEQILQVVDGRHLMGLQ